MTAKRTALLCLQWSVSLALIFFLFIKLDFAAAARTTVNANPVLLAAAVLQLCLQPVLGAIRWKIVIRALRDHMAFPTALRFVWIGTFFNQALPGSIGGDVVRIWLHWRDGAARRLAINGVVLERLIMLLALLFLVAAVQPGIATRVGTVSLGWVYVLLLGCGFLGLAILMFSERLGLEQSPWRIIRAIGTLVHDSKETLLRPLVLFLVGLAALAAYVNLVLAAWLIALALHLPVTFTDCVILIPVALLTATLPISISGWGVREGVIVVLFATIHVPASNALALSVLFGLCGIVASLPGLAMWLATGRTRADLVSAERLAKDDSRAGLDS